MESVVSKSLPEGIATAVVIILTVLTGGSLNYYSLIGLAMLIRVMSKNGMNSFQRPTFGYDIGCRDANCCGLSHCGWVGLCDQSYGPACAISARAAPMRAVE